MRIAVLAGGIGAARFLRGLLAVLGPGDHRETVTVIGNTGDDITLHGLRVCPDLDTVMYTLGGGISADRGWGREDETFTVKEELGIYGVGPAWFGLGDRDLATHLVRTELLDAGYPLSQVTEGLCDRWQPRVRLLPMSDDRVETHVVIADDGLNPDPADTTPTDTTPTDTTPTSAPRRAIHFQEWWLRLHAQAPAEAIIGVGADTAVPAPGVLDAIGTADVVLLPPSNPVVSIGTILSVPGIRDALAATHAPVVGVSPIIGGAPVHGMADACLTAIGVETSAAAVARHYGADLLDGWLVDETDAAAVPRVAAAGIACRAIPLLMRDVDATAQIARASLDLAETVRR